MALFFNRNNMHHNILPLECTRITLSLYKPAHTIPFVKLKAWYSRNARAFEILAVKSTSSHSLIMTLQISREIIIKHMWGIPFSISFRMETLLRIMPLWTATLSRLLLSSLPALMSIFREPCVYLHHLCLHCLCFINTPGMWWRSISIVVSSNKHASPSPS